MADMRRAFLDSIRAEPDDDAPRLIFADWLDEHGGEDDRDRAEFIRLQVALARGAAGEDARKQADRLLTIHRREWLSGCEGIEWTVEFRRGFGEAVKLAPHTEAAFAARAARLFDLEPVQEITIDAAPGYLGTFTGVPQLSRIRCLRAPYLDERFLSELLGSPHLTGLRTLDLSKGTIGADGVSLLLGSAVLGHVTDLSLAGCRNIEGYDWDGIPWTDDTRSNVGEEGVVTLAASPRLARLRRLDLSWNRLGDAAVEALVRCPHLGDLAELRIGERGRVEHDPATQSEREGPSSLTPAAVQRLRARFGSVVRMWRER